jgi:dynein heavy chain
MFIAAVYKFVVEQMGESFVQTGTIDLKEMFEESTAKTPLIFILSPGN